MVVSFHERVALDLEEGAAFYERQEPGVGDHFIDSILNDAENLATTGGIHRQVFGFHRLLGSKFPFAVYDRIENSNVKIYAILDLRSNSTWIRDELSYRN